MGSRVVGPLKHPDTVRWIQFSPDASTLVTSCGDHVYLWNANTGKQVSKQKSQYSHLTFSPDGTRLAGATIMGNVKIWDPVTGQDIEGPREHVNDVTSLCFSPNGTTLASASSSTIHICMGDIL
ncbi:quinon protein alcohol dehydrogenase-like superfamily [Roridomyces roridus]|uniref:Quinon protein alcohol dehydrogenase-like superfamily n=1 Tax=Roridomyces roridus TaxID=1738132 RepID=A0AAD7BJ28_9AGAR|nr:quinon protein alcohol dehydrogenase-like superfamily [Roridomyces roridus]